ncbi:MAG: Gfo/Idh/MocA family oxidoreductase [Planctomycetota bacterium]
MNHVRYAVAGGGAIAQRRHLPEAHAYPKSSIVAVCDPLEERVKGVADHYNARPFVDFDDMLAKADCDAVVVATPNADHAPQTIKALEAGKHVLVEKPMATNSADAKAMIAASEKSGKFLMVGMNQRLMPPHVKAREILDTGKIGKIITFETNFKHGGPDNWSLDGASSWFFKKDRAVLGVNGDLGIHKADLMRFLLDDEFATVGGFVKTLSKTTPDGKLIPVDDNAFLELETKTGIVGSIHISWTNFGRFGDNGTALFGEKGVMRIGMDDTYGVMVDLADGSKERYIVGAMATNEKQTASGIVDSFTECILSNTPPTIDGSEGYKALQVILTAVDAAEQGKFLDIEY